MSNETLTKNTKHLLQALFQSGVRHFVVSPGSRSTPIALLLAEFAHQEDRLQLYVDVDERSAGFFALGIAKTIQEPVAVLGTSGTAIVEYTAAVAEAAISHIPLIILSTDRPAELQQNGAPQTLSQQHLFGDMTKNYLEITLQDSHPDVTAYIDFMVQKQVHSSISAPRGPLQINLPLRKPLMPVLHEPTAVAVAPLVFETPIPHFDPQQLAYERVVILAGPNEGADYQQALAQFSRANHVPVIADVLSRVRTPDTIYGIDALIKAGKLATVSQPDLVIRFGATPVSALVLQWLSQNNIPVWHVDEQAGTDHSRHLSRAIIQSPQDFLRQVTVANQPDFAAQWQALNHVLRQPIGELALPHVLDQVVAPQTPIFVANSMAIRDMDDVFTGQTTQRIYANRGANGIDGVVSTAMGMSSTTNQRSILLTGDLTLFHDMNGLMMARQYQLPIDIIVVNNDGGAIFSFLPQAAEPDYFELLFGTPLGLEIEKIAALYDIPFVTLAAPDDLASVLGQPVKGPRMIAYTSDRQTNVAAHRRFLGDPDD
ncbi:2-succinyl-5-enolpyruvyl-6-hydroxy-3-cyclohexene-1-carboxylic-acid synthase [Leuconostoc lactis]